MDVKIEELQKEGFSLEFIYATRLVESLSKINLKVECNKIEAIKMVERGLQEYTSKSNLAKEKIG